MSASDKPTLLPDLPGILVPPDPLEKEQLIILLDPRVPPNQPARKPAVPDSFLQRHPLFR